MAQKVVFITAVGTGTYTIPSDFDSLVSVEGIGGGGGGTNANGGGGGAYAASTAINTSSWVPGVTGISYQVGAGGNGGNNGTQTAGGDTWFGSASPSTTTGILAKGGGVATGNGTSSTAAGGSAASSVGTTKFSGGASAAYAGVAYNNAGGGGAAGPGGDGGVAGAGFATTTQRGSGGGGGGAGLTSAGFPGSAGTNTTGGNGGSGGASVPIDIIGANEGHATSNPVITVPSGTQDGDIMVLVIRSSAASITTPSGWTVGTAYANGIAAYYKTASSEPANYTVTTAGSASGYILTARNAELDVSGSVSANSTAPVVSPGITLSRNSSLLIDFVASMTTPVTFTEPTGFTSLGSNTVDMSSSLFIKSGVSSGATGDVSSSISSSTGRGVLVGLKPSSLGGGVGGGGAGGSGTAGTGGGGAGSFYGNNLAGTGGTGSIWTQTSNSATAGPGGGGGGAGWISSESLGGPGGLYGGGGGSGLNGTGAQGIIVFTYNTTAEKTVFITTVGTGTYTIPNDFQSLVSVEGIGGGGGGGPNNGSGGGGAYAASTAINTSSWVPGVTGISYQVGSGGGNSTAGTDTWFGSATPTTTTGILAKGGGTSAGNGGAGGSAASCVGTTVFSGGSGVVGGSGGGGAAGPGGAGGNGSAADSATTGRGGGGGGASLTAAGSNAGAASASASGAGGNGGGGTGGGASVSVTGAGNSGTAGTGGGGSGAFGASASNVIGGNGGTGSYWTQTSDSATAGSGGGAGGSSGLGGTNVSGGLYGGGGGSGGTGATFAGAQGIIVFTYVATSAENKPYQPFTSFAAIDENTGNFQDLGSRYITKDYLLDVYPNIASATGNRTAPGLWGWGINTQGQIGNSTLTAYSSPVQVGTLPHWKQVGAQFHTLAIKTDGTLWAWGINFTDGRLGFNTLTNLNYSSPTQVGALTNWKYVGHQGDHSMAVKTDGTLWAWGANAFGQCGHVNTSNYSSPTQVGALTNWKFVDSGYYHTLAIDTVGALWSWGMNRFGQLGNGNTTYYSSPVQIGALTNWKQISAGGGATSFAIKTDGTLWAWGLNTSGQLGIGNTTNYSSPVQVGALTNWKQVVCSPSVTDNLISATHTLAVTTQGALWAWGNNTSGQLGLGNTTYYSSPIQVGSLTNWKYAAATVNASYGIKTDGTIWAWGQGAAGKLGLNTTSNYSSPVQIGSLTSWKSIISGHQTVFGIQDGYI